MANELTGAVTFEVEGQEMVLLLDINALCEVETRLNRKTSDFVDEIETMGLSMLRTLFWAGLQDRHPGVSPKDAGKIVQQIRPAKARELVLEAFVAAFPELKAREAAPDAEDP